ncbi:3-phosphoshikimate 1-carboxyvinyltransferase [Sphingobacterium griseoflavum]|uniref:3-phosphoshikimate 1-carboxyvinyltransferase n=1 Tax=Sphingobacterium griseoflavum TaxID=1474952 RepID=A0ABQ3HY16_9SPHI|nr:3-phosphoshikimate 1-carboxyvinyltransferase [Sphingobacterium griseoflavum]GHE30796.1 3-phosphoshikimate 1-carboxyvinyltransferase [Sphingobacterium griseoflavum]
MGISTIRLSHSTKNTKGTVQLTGSKSESNRALIIQALSKGLVAVENLSEAADTLIMQHAIKQAAEPEADKPVTIDIGPAGTAMRFLTSYLNLLEGEFLLTGTERMQQRPIGILVEALQTLGANITYSDREGYPPLMIRGRLGETKNHIAIQGNISSQYISSLLLIAASLKKGLALEIIGELTSRPYVTMTLDMLREAGINHTWDNNVIEILPQTFKPATIFVEPDWSAASYWYAIVALSTNGSILLPGLKAHSLQGDIAIVDIMTHFGVASSFQHDGLLITKVNEGSEKKLFDFKACPDLAQTVVAVAAALRRDISIKGVETLKIKETDRLAALKTEIEKFGATIVAEGETYHIKTNGVYNVEHVTFDTYEDHRMAMAFAPLALVFKEVSINEPQVVEKSYPDYWLHLEQQGFQIHK